MRATRDLDAFPPAFVVVAWGTEPDEFVAMSGIGTGPVVRGLRGNSDAGGASSTNNAARPELASGGFVVSGAGSSLLNASGITYRYMAIG